MTLTPEQFNKLATKEDLKDLEEKIVSKEEFREFKSDVLGAVDGLAKKFDNFSAEMAANRAAHERFEEAIDSLKNRVSVLERKST